MPKTMYPAIQPLAWMPMETASVPLVAMPFPAAWTPPLRALAQEATGKPWIPIRSLNAALRALVTPLVTLPGGGGGGEGDADVPPPVWLLAREVIDPGTIWLVVRAWLEYHYQACSSYTRVLAQIRPEALVWHPHAAVWDGPPAANGTARPPDRQAWVAVPFLLADAVLTAGLRLPVGQETRPLVRVAVPDGADLLTWPPVFHRKGTEQWGYSYVLSIRARTILGEPRLRIHVGIGVRRWVSFRRKDKDTYLGPTTRSVYLRTTRPWLGYSAQQTMTVAGLRWDHETQASIWTDGIAEIAARCGVAFPAAPAVHGDPARWIRGVDGVEAALVYHHVLGHPVAAGIDPTVRETLLELLAPIWAPAWIPVAPFPRLPTRRSRPQHPLTQRLREVDPDTRLTGFVSSVGPQATLEIYALSEALRDSVADGAWAALTRPLPPLIDPADPRAESPEAWIEEEPEEGEEPAEGEPAEGPAASGGHLEIPAAEAEPAVSTPALNDARKAKVVRVRAPEPPPAEMSGPQEIALPGGRVRLIAGALRALRDPLRREPGDKWTGRLRLARAQERIDAIVRDLPPAREPTVAIIELPNYQDPRHPDLRKQFALQDPFDAIRVAMARTGRLTQFIQPPRTDLPPDEAAADLRMRAHHAVLDGLRQLGYAPAPMQDPSRFGGDLPAEMLIVAVRMIRITRRRNPRQAVAFPCAVLMDTTRTPIWAWLPDGKGIRPYREALLQMAQLAPGLVAPQLDKELGKRGKRGELSKAEHELLERLQYFLLTLVPKLRPAHCCVLVDAQNLRGLWKWLTDPAVIWDHIQVGDRDRPVPVATLPGGLRMIRLRTKERQETPEWFAPGGVAGSAPSGVWADPTDPDGTVRRLFYSTGPKPHTQKGGKKGKQQNPREQYANPSLLEIVPIALQPGDTIPIWAQAVTHWRNMNYLTPDVTLFPWPLYLAEAMRPYAEVIGPWVWPDDDPEDELAREEEDGDATTWQHLRVL